MYDLPGTDTGREWIELYNDSAEEVDISKWTLREADTNYKLEVSQGSALLAPQGYAILADTPAKFLSDNPGFLGTLFDSSFSLSNTGETLVLKNGDSEVDSTSYTTDMGGVEGATLNREGNTFKNGLASPGKANTVSGSTEPVTTEASSTKTGTTSMQTETQTTTLAPPSSGSYYKVEQQIFPDAGPSRVVFVGSEVSFMGSVLGLHKEPLQNARFVWNFGDGETKEGKQVVHTYRFLGEYIVTLDVSSGEFSQGDRTSVKVINPALLVSQFLGGPAGYTELKNKSGSELDISRFLLKQGDKTFTLPAGTLVAGGGVLKIANTLSHFEGGEAPLLFYSTGVPVPTEEPLSEKVVLSARPPQAQSIVKRVESVPVATIETAKSFSQKQQENVAQVDGAAETKGPLVPFIIGVLALAGAVSGAVLFVRRTREEADQYTILEDEE